MDRVSVYEVGPRDGLQNESVTLSTQDKLAFIEQLVAAGVRDIEVSTAVSGPGSKTQGHTSWWNPDTRRLITTAAQDGALIELDPVAGAVTRRLEVPGADLIQGCVVDPSSWRSA